MRRSRLARRAHRANGDRAGGAGAACTGGRACGHRPRQRRVRLDRSLIRSNWNTGLSGNPLIFTQPDSRSRSGLLPGQLPLGILSLNSCTAGVSAGPEVVRSGANHVGRSRGDASKPAVVHLIGTSRHDRARLCFVCRVGTRFGRRYVALGGDFGLARPQSPGIRGADDGIVAARLYRRGGDPVDAHPRQGDPHRGPPAHRHRRTADAGRPVARAAVRRAANPDFLGRRRQPAPDQRRHRAV